MVYPSNTKPASNASKAQIVVLVHTSALARLSIAAVPASALALAQALRADPTKCSPRDKHAYFSRHLGKDIVD